MRRLDRTEKCLVHIVGVGMPVFFAHMAYKAFIETGIRGGWVLKWMLICFCVAAAVGVVLFYVWYLTDGAIWQTRAWLRLRGMVWPASCLVPRRFKPSWQKFATLASPYRRIDYVMDHDVNKEWGRAGFDALKDGRKKLIRFYWLQAEVNNGAMIQYFWNSSGDMAADLINDLREIGADYAADLIERASMKFFSNRVPPRDTMARRAKIEAHCGTEPFNIDGDFERLKVLEGKDTLETETDEFRGFEDRLTQDYVNWINRHRDYFTHIIGGA